MTSTCFMVQPFDGGAFDKRFEDVFAPAVRNAGLEPYRVDRDPKVSIPIEDIEAGIQQATTVFVDITRDNPNVWFELGYALALNKDVCLVCEDKRESRYPFDIQHRSVIKYKTESKRDFDELEGNVTARLKAILERQQARTKLPTISSRENDSTLADHIVSCLASLAMVASGLDGMTAHYEVRNEMEKLGYNNLATGAALRSLLQNGFIAVGKDNDDYGNEFNAYCITSDGWDWIAGNLSDLKIHIEKPGGAFDKELDDEIPF